MSLMNLNSPPPPATHPNMEELEGEEESEEEEEKTDDEAVEVVEIHDNICIDIPEDPAESEAKQDTPERPAASLEPTQQDELPGSASASALQEKASAEKVDHAEQTTDSKFNEVEEIVDSDEDKRDTATKGVFKVGDCECMGFSCNINIQSPDLPIDEKHTLDSLCKIYKTYFLCSHISTAMHVQKKIYILARFHILYK